MKISKSFAAILLAGAVSTGAQAAFINTPVPSNAFVTHNSLDWAWAFPLPASSGLDLSAQSAYGWRLPTLEELAFAPTALQFIFSGANVPLNGADPVSGATFQASNSDLTGAAACATPYFSNSYRHCDWQDGLGQPYGPWSGMADAPSWADQLVVRGARQEPPANVPEPAPLALLGLGIVGWLAARRRAKA